MIRRPAMYLLLSLAAFAGAGCTTGDDSDHTPTPAGPQTTATPVTVTRDATYDAVASLARAFVQAGGACPDYQVVDSDQWSTTAWCSGSTVLSVFTNAGFVAAREHAYQIEGDIDYLAGPNWIINADSGTVATVAPTLGGDPYWATPSPS